MRRGVYPRLRGGSYPNAVMEAAGQGLSPPTRGIPHCSMNINACLRSIPAYAGDPPQREGRPTKSVVYPRLRGGSRIARGSPSYR